MSSPRRRSASSMSTPCSAAMSAMPPATLTIMMSRSWRRWPVAELVVQLARLGVDHHGFDGAGVVAVQQVRERAVAPEAAGEVELDEEAGHGIEHLLAPRTEVPARDQLPVGECMLHVVGDDGGGVLAVARDPRSGRRTRPPWPRASPGVGVRATFGIRGARRAAAAP